MKHKRSQRTYHLRNWSDYNKALVNRGSLTIWLADETVTAWINHAKTGRPGASQTYTEAAILCMLTLMAVYSLRLRSTQGLLHSLFRLAEIDLTVPDYTRCVAGARCWRSCCHGRRRVEPSTSWWTQQG